MAAKKEKKRANGFNPMLSLYIKNNDNPNNEINQYGNASLIYEEKASGLLYNACI